jgi:hypothetical protein
MPARQLVYRDWPEQLAIDLRFDLGLKRFRVAEYVAEKGLKWGEISEHNP